jgi:hypothetical protein
MAAAVPAALFWFPMYFLTWSRFTQLAGLVLVPIAWILVARAMVTARRGAIVAAAVASAGVCLVHYRVSLFFAIGTAVLVVAEAGRRRANPRTRWRPFAVVILVAGAAVALAAPWLIDQLRFGLLHLAEAGREVAAAGGSSTWYGASEEGLDVPRWLFTQRSNDLWLAAGLAGLLIGAVHRSIGAWSVLVTIALVTLAGRPGLLHLPSNWLLPGFSVAISLFVPVGIGLAYLVHAAMGAARALGVKPAAVAGGVRIAAVVATCLAGFPPNSAGWWPPRAVPVIHPPTVIATAADVAAGVWIQQNTPVNARFLVGVEPWHMGSYRGVDGGYWLPVLAHRQSTMPGGLYSFGDPAEVRAITSFSDRVTAGNALSDAEIEALMDESGAEFVYVGPAGADLSGKLRPADLQERPFLHLRYERDGAFVFQRVLP